MGPGAKDEAGKSVGDLGLEGGTEEPGQHLRPGGAVEELREARNQWAGPERRGRAAPRIQGSRPEIGGGAST